MWQKISSYIYQKLKDNSYSDTQLRDLFNIPHKGFYIGILDSNGNDLLREGFLKESCPNVFDSANNIIDQIHDKDKEGQYDKKVFDNRLYLTLVKDLQYIENPLDWDENNDGIFMMFGQKFKGLYLPYQIRRMNCPKKEVLDRLASWECGTVSSLWALPETLVSKILCDSFA